MKINLNLLLLLCVAFSIKIDCAAPQNRVLPTAYIDHLDHTMITAQSLEQIQHDYESKSTIKDKSNYISNFIGDEEHEATLGQKIANLENLRAIITTNISLYSGWFWNEPANQDKIDWFYKKLVRIDKELADLRWKSYSFGYQTTIRAATIASYYLVAVLLAYAGLYQQAQATNTDPSYNFGQLATLPITKLISLATSAKLKE